MQVMQPGVVQYDPSAMATKIRKYLPANSDGKSGPVKKNFCDSRRSPCAYFARVCDARASWQQAHFHSNFKEMSATTTTLRPHPTQLLQLVAF